MRALLLPFTQSARASWYLRCFAGYTKIPLSGWWLKPTDVEAHRNQVHAAEISREGWRGERGGGLSATQRLRGTKKNYSLQHRHWGYWCFWATSAKSTALIIKHSSEAALDTRLFMPTGSNCALLADVFESHLPPASSWVNLSQNKTSPSTTAIDDPLHHTEPSPSNLSSLCSVSHCYI